MTIQMTETQAMTELIGKPVTMQRRTHAGVETILGSITTPLEIQEIEGQEVITAVTIQGSVVATKVAGMTIISESEPVTIEMIETGAITLL